MAESKYFDLTMSAKYANLPDIDSAQDVYETPDVEPAHESRNDQSSDEEEQAKANGEGPSIEELDPSSLLSAKEARKRFRKAEKRKARTLYSFTPGSDDSSESDSMPPTLRSRIKKSSRFERLLALKQEIASLEAEMADPSSSQATQAVDETPKSKRAQAEKESNDPAELLKGIHDVRARLEKLGAKDGRGRLVDAVVTGPVMRHTTGSSHTAHGHGSFGGTPLSPSGGLHSPGLHRREGSLHRRENSFGAGSQGASAPTHGSTEMDPGLAKLDSRLGELEKLVGSSSAALDESSPLPPPLLPMLSRLNAQLTILTQPRTIDSISRRLKLLLTDLDRVANQNATSAPVTTNQSSGMGHNRGTSTAGPVSIPTSGSGGGHSGSAIQDQLTPILQRLAPHLPTLPHILARLRTLSSLHAAAADFQRGMEQLEAQQVRNRSSLNDLEGAIKSMEKSMQENGEIERNNVQRLEASVQGLLTRLQNVE